MVTHPALGLTPEEIKKLNEKKEYKDKLHEIAKAVLPSIISSTPYEITCVNDIDCKIAIDYATELLKQLGYEKPE